MSNPPFYLQLMIGPGVPIPAGTDIMDALAAVSVTSNTQGASVFQLTFTLSTRSPLQTLFLIGGNAPVPILRVVILVIVSGLPNVLMDGVVTHTQIGIEGGTATLTVTGEDLSKLMDYLPLDGLPYPGMTPDVRVLSILARYMAFGVVPIVFPALIPDVPNPLEEIPRQQGTDLEYTRYLARLSGYEFYVDPGPLPLQSIGYWGPSIRIGVPQPALNTNMDSDTNVETMSFSFDAESATLPIVMIYP
jgi:hypothetical protein